MGEDDYVTESLCYERCSNIKSASKAADKNLKEWLKNLDSKFWALLFLGITSMLASIGALLMLMLNGGPK